MRFEEIITPKSLKSCTVSILVSEEERLSNAMGSLRKDTRNSLVLKTFKHMLLCSVQLLMESMVAWSVELCEELEIIS